MKYDLNSGLIVGNEGQDIGSWLMYIRLWFNNHEILLLRFINCEFINFDMDILSREKGEKKDKNTETQPQEEKEQEDPDCV